MRSFQTSHHLSRPSNLPLSYETLPSHFSLADNMLAGAFAGIAVRKTLGLCSGKFEAKSSLGAYCYVPCGSFEGEKLRQPQRGPHAQSAQTRLQVINPSPGGIYTSLTNAVSTITKIEGTASLWRGISSVIVGAGM